MAETIISLGVSFGCAMLFFFIGLFASKREKPMWFWSGTQVDESEITDVKQYNKENGRMWKLYSLYFFAAGIAGIWSSTLFSVILVLSFTVGLAGLILTYNKIYNKYKVK